MKNTCKLIIPVLIVVLFQGCVSLPRESPLNHDNSKWICENPEMFFVVDKEAADEKGSVICGECERDGVAIPFFVSIGHGNDIHFFSEPIHISKETTLFNGTFELKENNLIINITKNDFLDESIKEIVFIKQDN